MKVTTSRKKRLTYGIIGLPRSGTSIFTRAMGSIDGSLCLSEPIRTMHSINVLNSKDLHDYDIMKVNTNNFLRGYDKFIKVNSDEHQIGGIKETFSIIPSRVNREVNKIFLDRDFYIFIIRDPKTTYSRWKQLKWSNGLFRPSYRFNVKMFCNMYEQLIEKYHTIKMIKPAILVRYEDFCENFSCKWINDLFRGLLKFDGELENLKELSGSGDLKCKQSESILPPEISYTNLSEEESNLIDKKLNNLYKNLRGYGYY